MKRGILRRIRTLLFLTVIAASFSYRTSHAQDCNPLMPQAPVNSEVSNQIKANANILTKKLGSVEIDNQFKKVQEDVQSKYPHADTLSIWKSLIYLDCTLLQNSNLPPEEKQKQFLLLMDKFKQSPPPATAPATPRNMGRRERPQVINISGYVYNAKNEDPIPNLRVEVYNGGDAWTNHAGYFAIELGPPFKVGSY